MKKEYWYAVWAVAAVAALTALALWLTWGGPVQEEETQETKSRGRIADIGKKRSSKTGAAEKQKQAAERTERIAKERAKRRELLLEQFSPADRKLVDAVQAALDEDDFKATQKAVVRAMESEDPAVRSDAVEALGWFGDKALVDLTKAMADKNADVAESARSHVENALMGMEDDDRAFVLASEYLKMFAEDGEAVTMFAGVLSSTGVRIIDPDDSDSAEAVARAKGNRAGIVDIVDEMVSKGGKLAEKGRELYEEITGDEWSGRATADAWANDIEEPQQEELWQEDSNAGSAESSES